MLNLLKSIVSTTNSRVIGQVVTSKANRNLREWILAQTQQLPNNVTMIERVHVILDTSLQPFCSYGNKQKFASNPIGYKFCGTVDKCRCYKEQRNIIHPPLDQDKVALINQKRKKTWIDRYGVDNPSKDLNIRNKRKLIMKSKSYSALYHKMKIAKQQVRYDTVIDQVKDTVTPVVQ